MFYKFLYIIPFLFFISCDFDDNSLSVSDINQDELYHQKFLLDTNLSRTVQNYPSIGESSLLYAGKLDSMNYSYTIIDFDNSIFKNYDLCTQDSISYKNIYLVMDLINSYQIANQNNNTDQNINNNFNDDTPPILGYWIAHDALGLDFNINWDESDINIISGFELTNIDDNAQKLYLDNHQGKYYLDLSSQLIIDNNICNDILVEEDCNNQCIWISDTCESLNFLNICDLNTQDEYYLLIKTAPESDLLYEFASSEYISDYSNTEPYLNIIYDEYKELNKQSNKFIINNISNYLNSSLYISDTLMYHYNYVFVADSISNNNDSNSEVENLIDWTNQDIYSPLDIVINENQELLEINIDLINIDNFSNSGVHFWLDSIKYFKYLPDPHNDNYPNGTENNALFDISDSNDYPGEFIYDYGIDGCFNEYENGFGGCDSLSTAYNDLGTQNNYFYDDGEYYEDVGSDGCPDEYETGIWDEDTGIGICACDFPDFCTEDDIVDDINDLNQDNYNIDPSNDDWFDINNNGVWDDGEKLEGNGLWDNGEPFYDVGLDGLDSILVGYSDEGEGNGFYDFGETFFDTGIDSLFTQCPSDHYNCTNIEPGYNPFGNENDNTYQLGEPFNDCGEDGLCDDNDSSDDYNIDPNSDNWSDCGSDMLCPNNENYIGPDDDGTELNGLWDENEGTELNNQLDNNEIYDDYGIDGISNLEEISQLLNLNQKISVSKTDTTYYDYSSDSIDYPDLSNQENDSLKVWISSIEKNSENNLKITISVLAEHEILGLEFQLNHDIHEAKVMDWDNKQRNVAKIDYESYIKDFSLFNNGPWNKPNNLSLNYALGFSSILNFDGLDLFIDDNRDVIINEANSFLTIFLDKDNDNFLLESDSYMISFDEPWENFPNQHESDDSDIVNLFLYNVNNNPDSLKIPIGNLIQNYINKQSVYSGENSCMINDVDNPGCDDGIWLNLRTTQIAQYPFNFNNIVLDQNKPPILDIYYFK